VPKYTDIPNKFNTNPRFEINRDMRFMESLGAFPFPVKKPSSSFLSRPTTKEFSKEVADIYKGVKLVSGHRNAESADQQPRPLPRRPHETGYSTGKLKHYHSIQEPRLGGKDQPQEEQEPQLKYTKECYTGKSKQPEYVATLPSQRSKKPSAEEINLTEVNKRPAQKVSKKESGSFQDEPEERKKSSQPQKDQFRKTDPEGFKKKRKISDKQDSLTDNQGSEPSVKRITINQKSAFKEGKKAESSKNIRLDQKDDSLVISGDNSKTNQKQNSPYIPNSYARFMVEASDKVMDKFEKYLGGRPNSFFKEFLQANPDVAKMYIDEKKSNPMLTEKDFFLEDQVAFDKMVSRLAIDSEVVKNFVTKDPEVKQIYNDSKAKKEEDLLKIIYKDEQAMRSYESAKMYSGKSGEEMTAEDFVKEFMKKDKGFKERMSEISYKQEEKKDYDEFLSANKDLKKEFEKKKAQGEVVDAKQFIENNKKLMKEFEEFKGDNIDKLNMRKFVETNPEVQAMFVDFKKKNGEVSYEEFLQKDRKAQTIWERDVVYNADSALNMEKFMLANPALKESIVSGSFKDVRSALDQSPELRKQYQEFMRREQEGARMAKFLESKPELKKKFSKETKANPSLSLRQFLEKEGKQEEYQEFSKKEEKKIEVQNFIQNNEELRKKLDILQRQNSQLDVVDLLDKNDTLKEQFDEYQKEKNDERTAKDFIQSKPDIERRFNEAKKKNQDLTEKEFLQTMAASDSRVAKDLQRFEQDTVADQKKQEQLHDFATQNDKLLEEFSRIMKEDPQSNLTFDQFVQEKAKDKKVKQEMEDFLLKKQDKKDYDEFLSANKDLKKEFEKKKAQGEVVDAKQFIENNKKLMKEFEEFKGDNIDKLNMRKFVETNPEVQAMFVDFKKKNGEVSYEEFLQKDRKAQTIWERDVVYNADSALNMEKFMLANPALKESIVSGSFKDVRSALDQSPELRKQYQEFMRREQEGARMAKFLESKPELKKKFSKETKANPSLSLRQFLEKEGKQEEYQEFSKKEEKKIEVQNFIQNNEELRKKLDILQRQNSQLDVVDLLDKNDTLKEQFDEYQKEKNDERTAKDFIQSKPDIERRFNEAKKKNQDLTEKEFLQTMAASDSRVAKDLQRFEQDTVADQKKQEQLHDFATQNDKLLEEFSRIMKEDPQSNLTFDQFVQEKAKDKKVKQEMEDFLLKKQDKKDYDEFLSANKDLKKEFEKKKAQGEVVDAKQFIENNKKLMKEFEEFKGDNIDKLNMRKFVETNPEVQAMFVDFKKKNGEVSYEEFLQKDRKAQTIWERDVVYNADSALNMEKFMLANPALKESIVSGSFKDVRSALDQSPELRKQYQEFMRREQEGARMAKFLESKPELKKKFSKETKANPSLSLRQFLEKEGKQEEYQEFSKKEEKKIEVQNFIQNNEELRKKLDILQRQNSQLDVVDLLDKNDTLKEQFDEYQKEKNDERTAKDFIQSKPDIERRFNEAKKKNQDLTEKEFLQTMAASDSRVAKDLQRFEQDTVADQKKQEQLHDFATQNDKLLEEFSRIMKEDPQSNLTFDQFVQEKAKDKKVKQEMEDFLLKKQDKKDYDEFLSANKDLKKEFEKKKAQGEVVDAKQFIENNKKLMKEFEEFKGDNIDKLNMRKFVETNPEVQAMFVDFKKKNGEVSYEEFLQKDRKAQTIWERDVVYNADSALNMEKFMLANPALKESIVSGSFKDVRSALDQSPELRKQYQEFMRREQEGARMAKFLESKPELKKKFSKETKANPSLSLRQFLEKEGKQEEYQEFSKKEEKKIEVQNFIQNNEELRKKLDILQRQNSQLDVVDLLDKNDTLKEQFDEYQKEKNDERTAKDFIQSKPDIERRFNEAKKKNQDLTEKEFLQTMAASDSRVAKDLQRFEQDTVADQKKQEQLHDFATQNDKLLEEFSRIMKEDPQSNLTFDQFVQEKAKDKKVKQEMEDFLLKKQDKKDYDEFLSANKDLKKEFEKKKAQGEVVDAKQFIENNKKLMKEFEEFKGDNIDKLNMRKFVETNPEVQAMFVDFKKKNGEVSYEEFLQKDRKAQTIWERDVVYNADSALNMEKFMLANPALKESIVSGSFKDVRSALDQSPELRKQYQEFMRREQEGARMAKFLESKPELKKKFSKETKANPSLSLRQFLEKEGKQEEYQEFSKKEEKKIEVQNFIQNNEELRKKLDILQRQNSQLDVVDLLDKNDTLKEQFDEYQKEKNDERTAKDFIQSKPDIERRFNEAKKKNLDLTVNQFLHNSHPSLRHDYDIFKAQLSSSLKLSSDFEHSDLHLINAQSAEKSVSDFEVYIRNRTDIQDKYLKGKPKLDKEGVTYQQFITSLMEDKAVKKEYNDFLLKKQDKKDYDEFLSANKDLKKEFEKKKAQGEVVDAKQFIENNKKLMKEFEEFKGDNIDKLNMRKFVETNPEVQAMFVDFKKKNGEVSYEEFLQKDRKAQTIWERDVVYNADSALNMEKFMLANPALKKVVKEKGISIKDAIKSDASFKKAYDKFLVDEANNHKAKIKIVPNRESLPRSSIAEKLIEKDVNYDDQEFVEEFILSNRELKDSFVAAKQLDQNLTPQEFLKKAGVNVVRQLKQHEINNQRKLKINNFLLSNDHVRAKFEQAKKKNPKLTEEDYLHSNPEALDSYHHFIKRQDYDKVVDSFLKQNRDIEDAFLDFQDDTGQVDFDLYLNQAPANIRNQFAHYVKEQQKIKDFHKILNENPELKKQFLQAKSANRDLTDIQLLEKDQNLRNAINKAQVKTITFENHFQNFLMDMPEVKTKYEEFKKLNVNTGIKEFLDYYPELAAEFTLYKKNEDKLKTNFDILITKNSNVKEAFDSFVAHSVADSATMSKFIRANPTMKAKFEDYLMNSKSSKVNYESFVRSQKDLVKLFEHQKAKQNTLTFKQFVENNKSIGEAYKAFFKKSMETDAKLIEGYLRENPEVKSELTTSIKLDPSLLYKDFLQANEKAQVAFSEVQKKVGQGRKKSLMTEFLKSDTHSAEKLQKFIDSNDLTLNKNIFRNFINNDVVRKQKFLNFVKEDASTLQRYREFIKTSPQTTLEEYIRSHMFENPDLNKKFILANKGAKDDFASFVKKDESVVREFISMDKKTNSEFNRFINQNQKAKLNYEMYLSHNPQCQLSLEEYLAEHPEVLSDDSNEEVYEVFVAENSQLRSAYLKYLKEHPGDPISAKEFVQKNDSAKKLFKKFAQEDVIREIQNLAEFSDSVGNFNEYLAPFLANNEQWTLDILSTDHALKSKIDSLKGSNPGKSLAELVQLNPDLKTAVIETLRADKSALRRIIGGNKDLKEKFVSFVKEKQIQEADFEDFMKSNKQVKQIFNKMKMENPSLTIETFVKEAKNNSDIKDLYIRETLYNPDNNLTYHQFLKNDTEMKSQYMAYKKDPKNSKVSFDQFIENRKHDPATIERYKSVVAKDPAKRNFIRDFISGNSEVKNKFNQFVKESTEKESNFEKFVEGDKALKQSYDEYLKKNPKASVKDFVNHNPLVKAKYINFVKDHPETLEAFVKEDPSISQQYREFHINAQDDAHFDHFLKNSNEVKKEFENHVKKDPKSKITEEEFFREFKKTDQARKMFEIHQKNNTAEALSIAIRHKESNGSSSPIMKANFDFKESLFNYDQDDGKGEGAAPDEDKVKTARSARQPAQDGGDKDKNKNQGENDKKIIHLPEGDHSSIGSNLMSPLTGLKLDENMSEVRHTEDKKHGLGKDGKVGEFMVHGKQQNVSDRSTPLLPDIYGYTGASENDRAREDQNLSDTKARRDEKSRESLYS
jgi:GrpB-like predicted nucleotidyltransferase (UPF0157 family)